MLGAGAFPLLDRGLALAHRKTTRSYLEARQQQVPVGSGPQASSAYCDEAQQLPPYRCMLSSNGIRQNV